MKIGFLPLLCLLFIGLKLTGYVTWPWLWVLSPVLIPMALGVLAIALVVVARLLETPEQRIARRLGDLSAELTKRRR